MARWGGGANLRLLEEDGLARVDAARQQAGHHVQGVGPEGARVLRPRDGVQVGHAVQHRRVALLQGHPVVQGAQVVAQVGDPRGLDPGEHPARRRRRLLPEKRSKLSNANAA